VPVHGRDVQARAQGCPVDLEGFGPVVGQQGDVVALAQAALVQVARQPGRHLVKLRVGEHGSGLGHDHRGAVRILRGVRAWVQFGLLDLG
jgi:hypothetical protein